MSNAFVPVSVEGVVGRVRIEPGRPQRVDNQWILPPPGGKPGERVASATWWKRGPHTRWPNSMRVINRGEANSLKNPANRAPGPRPGLTSPPRRRGLFRATPRGLTPRATRQTLPHPPQPPIRPAPEPQGTTIDAIPYTSLVFQGKTPSSPRFPDNPPDSRPPQNFQKSQKSPD